MTLESGPILPLDLRDTGASFSPYCVFRGKNSVHRCKILESNARTENGMVMTRCCHLILCMIPLRKMWVMEKGRKRQ